MDGWDQYYECVARELDRQMERHLHLFSESLEWWLHAEVNWPSRDWEVQLQHLVDHTRYYGLEIHPVSIQSLHDLVEARVNGTGPFEAQGPYCWDEPAVATGEPIQLALTVGLNDGTRTDATVALASDATPTTKDGVEVAGAGPGTTRSFQDQVHAALAILDVEVAIWWERAGGEIRSRAASTWTTFLRANEKIFVEDGKPVILVDENYTVALTAGAIFSAAHRMSVFKDLFDQERIPGPDEATRYAEVQQERVQEAAAIAAAIAQTYLATIGSLTPAGELVITVDEVSQDGFKWDHLLLLLPALPHLKKNLKLLTINLANGEQFRISGQRLNALRNLTSRQRSALLAKAGKAKTKKEALAIIERGATVVPKGRTHHIATNKNWVSTLRGGPWSPKFEEVFEVAGMNLADAENIVTIPGHIGPHPEAYHREIFDRLTTATKGKRKAAYKQALIGELEAIAKEVRTKGTKLNRLLTN